MFYETVKNDHGMPNDPFKALVAPRPIAWISTLGADGIANLAPYSFFNAFAQSPHYVAFGSGSRKDTINNIEANGEFAINLVSYGQRKQMNDTSSSVSPKTDEFNLAGIQRLPCRLIAPPRVADSPATLECRLYQVIPLPDDNGRADDFLVIGRVVGIHIDDRFISDDRINTAAILNDSDKMPGQVVNVVAFSAICMQNSASSCLPYAYRMDDLQIAPR
jgi:flavin reductase (DIM6/NTAB) family NADH-FMN oxidoreductase RutF